MNQQILESRLTGLPLGGIRYFETIGSTNDAAADWAVHGAVDYSLVIANQQLQGRGRSGRKWITHPGTALAFSLVLLPSDLESNELTSRSTRFTGLGAVAVNQVLRDQYSLPAQIKWPNDVLIYQRKVCGILAEAHWTGYQLSSVILGIGINIATNAVPPEGNLVFPATSVEQELNDPVDRITILYQVLEAIIHWRPHLLEEIFLQTWEANLAYLGEWVQVVVSSDPVQEPKQPHVGRILGLDPNGSLRLCTHSGDVVIVQQGEIPLGDDNIRLRPVDRSPK